MACAAARHTSGEINSDFADALLHCIDWRKVRGDDAKLKRLAIGAERNVFQDPQYVCLLLGVGKQPIVVGVNARCHGGRNGDTGHQPHRAIDAAGFDGENRRFKILVKAMSRRRRG